MSSFIGVSPKLPLRKGGSQGREGDDAAGGGYNMNGTNCKVPAVLADN